MLGSLSIGFGNSNYNIPFENVNGLMLIEANFDGQQGHFIFDTGADEIILHTEDRISSQAVFETLDGSLRADEYHLESLQLGNYLEEDVTVYKADLQSLRKFTGTHVVGIIGLSLFDLEVLHIDNITNTIQLYSLEDINKIKDRKFIRNKMSLVGNLPVMNVEIGGQDYRFGMDSGATTSFVCESVISEQDDQFDLLEASFDMQTAVSISQESYYLCDGLTLGKLKLRNLTFGSSDFSEMDSVSGILSIDSLPSDVIIFDFVTRHIYMSI